MSKTMGDMKTPDFDDLLAAFDIPDMVDPKAAIESGHAASANEEEAHNPPGHDIGVSVIVKNVRSMDMIEDGGPRSGKDTHCQSHFQSQSLGNGLHNGRVSAADGPLIKNGWKVPRDERQPGNNRSATLNHFSPISTTEEFEDDKIEVEDLVDKQRVPSFVKSTAKKQDQKTKAARTVSDHKRKQVGGDQSHDQSTIGNGALGGLTSKSCPQTALPKQEVKKTALKSRRRDNMTPIKAKPSAKLSSCIAAIAALSAQKPSVADLAILDYTTTQKDSPQPCEIPRALQNPPETELAKRLTRRPDSPSSVTSDGSNKGSPASGSDASLIIPKVRIKTIKTSSGQIKRTVTSVPPEFDPEKSDNTLSVVGNPSTFFPSPAVVATAGVEITKQMTIKPLATAFLPVSAVKTAGSQIINLKLANNTTVKAKVIPAASVQSASSAILKAANAIQQQTLMVPASSLASAKLVPKTLHLGSLNLLPQSVSDLHQVLSSSSSSSNAPLQPKQRGAVLAGPASRKVQMFAGSQSSVVDAFNKVLSSVNPVPVYVPNLCPPSSACISLPSHGYRCLECGDSFALEKSLTRHYERRSVRIEVTCNHCSKSLVFYNKCSLLSHARGHKDKGVVMQCSHLILKPIPTDQMIPSPGPAAGDPPISQAHSPAGQTPGNVGGAAVISSPCGAPLVAAMPLEDDASKLCRNTLKCLECSEVFQDDSSLAMHYQHTPESTEQKTCTVCQMLLPNQCSFLSHQRLHQHRSPHVCPECGASCRSVHFQSHVTKNCLHYTRRVGYRCVHCSVVFTDAAAVKSHVQSTHCEVFFKCSLCPMAFKSAPGTQSHALTQHPGTKPGEPKVIHKCSMCDTVFTLQSLLCAHFDQHVVSRRVSVFKCPDCSSHFGQKQLMLDHIKAVHGTLRTAEGPPSLGLTLPLSTKLTNSNCGNSNGSINKDGCSNGGHDNREKKPSSSPAKKMNSEHKNPPGSGYTCAECNHLFASREVFVAHVKREHGKILKKHPCRQCDKSFSSSHSLCRHNRLKHQGLRKVYTCPHCPALSQPFTKRVLLDQHIQLMHGDKDQEGRNVKSDQAEAPADKKMTLSPKRKAEEEDGDQLLGLNSRTSESQPPKRFKGNVPNVHKCAVCSFATEDLAAFHGHIPQHRCGGSSNQCQQCGLCYTSHRSLARHLFIVHRLKEPQGLGRYSGRGAERGDESQRENQLDVGDENEDGTPGTRCKVCGKAFETEGGLNTHMRTHGMAFIKSKRLSVTEK